MPLMPMPPMPTKWIGPDVRGSAASCRGPPVMAWSELPLPGDQRLDRVGQPRRRHRDGRDDRAASAAATSGAVQAIRASRRAATASAVNASSGISQPAPSASTARALAVWWSSVGVRVGHEDRRTSGRGELGHGRGAGAADHQLGVGQARRHVVEERGDLGMDAERVVGGADIRRRPRRGTAGRARSAGAHRRAGSSGPRARSG